MMTLQPGMVQRSFAERCVFVKVLLIQLLIVPVTVIVARAQPNECVEMVRSTYARMTVVTGTSQSIAVHYTVHTIMRDTVHIPASDASVEAKMSRSMLYVKSDEFESLRDTVAAATAIHATRSVYVIDALPERGASGNNDPFAMLRDSLLLQGNLVECDEVQDSSGETLKHVVLELSDGIQARLGLKRATFLIDRGNQTLKSIALEYTSPSPLLSVTITFDDIQYRADESEVEGLTAGNTTDIVAALHARYEGYRIVDRRTKRRNHQ